MTDIYPGAWSIVINYISNPMVEDSDDEKRINKTENKALKKKKEKENRLAKNLEIISVLMLSAMLRSVSFPQAAISWISAIPVWNSLNFVTEIPHRMFALWETKPSKERLPKNQTQQVIWRETDLVKDEIIHLYSSQFWDCYEYKENGNIWIKSRLKASIQFWNYIDASKFITNTIDSGYKISFYSLPKGRFPKNNISALQKDNFVRGEIKDLMDAGLISEQYEVPFVTNPLSVSVNSSGKRRHIFNIREVNKHIWTKSVKYEAFTALLCE